MATATLRARATLDNTGFKRGIAEMQQGVQRFGAGQLKQLGAMIGGAFAVGAVVNFVRNTGEAADEIQDLAQALGMSNEKLQTLQVLADRNGSSAEAMGAALKRAALEGVSIEDVAKVMRGIQVEGVSAEQAMRVAGRSGAELNTVFEMIATQGLDSLQAQLLNTNQIMSEDTVNAAGNMQKSFNRAITSMTNQLREFAVTALTKLKTIAAFWGAVAGGASFGEASDIASETVASEFAEKEGTSAGLNKLQIDKGKTDKSKMAKESSISVAAPEADSLAKIGGIIGPQFNPMRQAAERNLKIAEAQEKLQQQMADALEKVEKNTSILQEE